MMFEKYLREYLDHKVQEVFSNIENQNGGCSKCQGKNVRKSVTKKSKKENKSKPVKK